MCRTKLMQPLTDPVQISTPWSWNTWQLRQHRIIHISGEFDTSANEALQESLLALSLESDQPITILIHSPGGEVLEGLGMFDIIRATSENGVHITIHVVGTVASMAAILLQAADHRVMTPNSRMLLHEVREFSFMSTHTVSDAVDKANELKVLNDRLATLVAGRTNGIQTPGSIKDMWKKDYWLWPKEALTLGLIDEIALVNFK